MSKPVVAIIGRPNVGKSSFFNALLGERVSIVDDTPGVTRDRIYATATWREREFLLIDTGGIEPDTDDILLKGMRAQAQIAIDTADVILFICDLKSGLTASDHDIAIMLRKSKQPVVVCVNKVDHVGNLPAELYEFYNLGLGEVYPISAAHRLGIGELLDALYEHFPDREAMEQDEDTIRVALIGKPNAGKSSLANKMIGSERSIVSDIPGTTRDAIDTVVVNSHGTFTIIDTAGLRKKSRIEDSIEKYSMIRALTAIERSNVCVILIDAVEGVTEQDTKVAGYAHNGGKACIIAVNKWDLIEKATGTLETQEREVRERFAFMSYAPINSPFRKTVIRSQTSYTCSRKCVMKMMPTPRALSSRISEKSFSTSRSSSEEVGSSRISTLHSISIARAMATICCTASEHVASCCVDLAGMFSFSRISTVFLPISRQLTK